MGGPRSDPWMLIQLMVIEIPLFTTGFSSLSQVVVWDFSHQHINSIIIFVASNSSNQQVEITNHEIMRRVVEKHNLQELFKVILLIHMTYTHILLI